MASLEVHKFGGASLADAAAYRHAVALGASFIETDLHLTRDARLVAIHDASVDRTTNGHGLVKEYTLAEIRELDAGSWFDPKFAGEKIPTLEEIIAFARQADVVFYLEVKTENSWGVEHSLVGALRQVHEVARAAILSFDEDCIGMILRGTVCIASCRSGREHESDRTINERSDAQLLRGGTGGA